MICFCLIDVTMMLRAPF